MASDVSIVLSLIYLLVAARSVVFSPSGLVTIVAMTELFLFVDYVIKFWLRRLVRRSLLVVPCSSSRSSSPSSPPARWCFLSSGLLSYVAMIELFLHVAYVIKFWLRRLVRRICSSSRSPSPSSPPARWCFPSPGLLSYVAMIELFLYVAFVIKFRIRRIGWRSSSRSSFPSSPLARWCFLSPGLTTIHCERLFSTTGEWCSDVDSDDALYHSWAAELDSEGPPDLLED